MLLTKSETPFWDLSFNAVCAQLPRNVSLSAEYLLKYMCGNKTAGG